LKLRNFKYVATNAEGRTVKGRIEAINRNVSLKYLQTKNYTVSSLVEYSNLWAKLNQVTIGSTLPTKQLIFFLKQLGSLLDAGVNLLSAIELLALQQESKFQRKLYFELYQNLYNGLSFSKALAKRPKEFPNMLAQMIEIGEISGDVSGTVGQMADYYEKQMKISSGIRSAMRMPLIYLGAAIVIAIGMLTFVFPNITTLFLSFEGAKLPWITQFFIDAGSFIAHYALYIFGISGLLVVVLILLNRYSKPVHLALTVFTLKLPIIGKLVQMSNQILIANSLAQMLSNGINSIKALQTIKSLVRNVVYKDLITKTLKYIEDGRPFSKAFEESSFIDPIMAKMIATGEKTAELPMLMKNLSNYYNGISELRVEQIKSAIQPLLLIVVYVIVGVMIIAIIMPMLSLGSQI